ncbi:MAG: hypothetical protein PUB52_02120 [Lachnospiraceae bacterium]|nr:hypothetical protein [Lachnospiraceae bacterium]
MSKTGSENIGFEDIEKTDGIWGILIKMLKKHVEIENIPIPILEYGSIYESEALLEYFNEAFDKFSTFPYVRRAKVQLEIPLYENEIGLREFFETYNSYSRFQNCTYGIAALSFRNWVVADQVNKDAVIQILDLVSRNRGNCLFIMTDVSKELRREFEKRKEFNFLFESKVAKPQEYIDQYCKEYKVEIKADDIKMIAEFLIEKPYTLWGRIMDNLIKEIYKNDCSFNKAQLETIRTQNDVENMKIGFHM